jgi:hypothetical protein
MLSSIAPHPRHHQPAKNAVRAPPDLDQCRDMSRVCMCSGKQPDGGMSYSATSGHLSLAFRFGWVAPRLFRLPSCEQFVLRHAIEHSDLTAVQNLRVSTRWFQSPLVFVRGSLKFSARSPQPHSLRVAASPCCRSWHSGEHLRETCASRPWREALFEQCVLVILLHHRSGPTRACSRGHHIILARRLFRHQLWRCP